MIRYPGAPEGSTGSGSGLKCLRKWGHGFKSHLIDWWSWGLNFGPLGTSPMTNLLHRAGSLGNYLTSVVSSNVHQMYINVFKINFLSQKNDIKTTNKYDKEVSATIIDHRPIHGLQRNTELLFTKEYNKSKSTSCTASARVPVLNTFLYFSNKTYMLWVLKRTVLMRLFILATKA